MKRTFTLGSGQDRRIVVVEVEGTRLAVKQKKPDGSVKKDEKVLSTDTAARVKSEQIIDDLIGRGYVEHVASATSPSPAKSKPTTASKANPTPKAKPKAKPRVVEEETGDPYGLAEEPEPVAPAAPTLQRITAPPASSDAEPAKKKKPGGKKKKRKKPAEGELDRRVIGAVAGVGVLLLGLAGYMAYDFFLKPATLVGVWAGSMIEFETGGPMSRSEYRLVLDAKKNASMTREEKFTSNGTYSVKGDRLILDLVSEKDEEGSGGEKIREEYTFALSRVTLDLKDPETGKLLVQLIRFRETPVVGKGSSGPPAASKSLASAAAGEGDPAADARLASVEFSPKDNAFKVKHPPGWESDTGSRPDNTYSWAKFTQGSAQIEIHADVVGSLMTGNNQSQHEEGSEFAPVHNAHELYAKHAAELYNNYKETKPTLFKGARLGEGRISAFTGSVGSVFSTVVRGYRVTLLTSDRRISILCHAPDKEFQTLGPTFLAVCRSLSR